MLFNISLVVVFPLDPVIAMIGFLKKRFQSEIVDFRSFGIVRNFSFPWSLFIHSAPLLMSIIKSLSLKPKEGCLFFSAKYVKNFI